jgi:hypothetical protein
MEDLRTALGNINTAGTVLGDLYANTDFGAGVGNGPINAAQASSFMQQVLSLSAEVDSPSTLESYQESHRMRVYGSRRFF